MTRSVYTLCGFQKFKPVGFCVVCVVCVFCGNYKQRRYKYKSLSLINCNLHFYHSISLMNLNSLYLKIMLTIINWEHEIISEP